MRERVIGISKYAHDGYFHLIKAAGGTPIEIDENTLLKEFDQYAGLVIPGGVDVAPDWYGQDKDIHTQSPNFQRDSLEIALVKRALAHDIPILGICRGHQVLNVAMGGTLKQHINGHVTHEHSVKICGGSRHFDFIGDKLKVNSLHHQSIDEVAPGLRVVARAGDVVEAVESNNHKFVVGVQWHPEMQANYDFNRKMMSLVREFVIAR